METIIAITGLVLPALIGIFAIVKWLADRLRADIDRTIDRFDVNTDKVMDKFDALARDFSVHFTQNLEQHQIIQLRVAEIETKIRRAL